MPHDPIRLADTRAWLAKADMDLKAAAHELTAAPPFTADAVFHAQIDALRQRFGRLARMGAGEPAPAAIIVREGDVEPELPDPIYGNAISTTWKRLCDSVSKDGGKRVIDFGVEALGAALDQGWSRNVLAIQIDSRVYERKGKATTNFRRTLPAPQSDLAQEATPDPYQFGFLSLSRPFRERETERQLVANVSRPPFLPCKVALLRRD